MKGHYKYYSLNDMKYNVLLHRMFLQLYSLDLGINFYLNKQVFSPWNLLHIISHLKHINRLDIILHMMQYQSNHKEWHLEVHIFLNTFYSIKMFLLDIIWHSHLCKINLQKIYIVYKYLYLLRHHKNNLNNYPYNYIKFCLSSSPYFLDIGLRKNDFQY